MIPSEFEAQLRADGFQEIERQELAARPGKGRHRHTFEIRGLVLDGLFMVTQDAGETTYGPGDTFSVALGELHDERIGDDGANVLVGRRFEDVQPQQSSSQGGLQIQSREMES